VSESILRLTPPAIDRLRRIAAMQHIDTIAIRLDVGEDGAAFTYDLRLLPPETERDDAELALRCEGISIYASAESVERARGTVLDYVDGLDGAGFRFANPNRPALLRDPVAARIQEVLESEINPRLASHGGRASIVAIRDRLAYIRMSGGCQGCGSAATTLDHGITKTLLERVPEIAGVRDATDHDAGTAPYLPREARGH